MNDTPKLAPRPSKGLQRAAYNVLHDMEDWLTVAEIHELLPSGVKGQHGMKVKLRRCMSNGVNRGYFLSEKLPGKREHRYRIADWDTYETGTAKAKKANEKSRAKTKKAIKKTRAAKVNGKLAQQSVINALEKKLALIDHEIMQLESKREEVESAIEHVKGLV